MRLIATIAIFLTTGFSSFSAVYAAGTAAGTDIQNQATISYDTLSGPITIDSNQVTVRVDELLDVIVNNIDAGPVITNPGKVGNVQAFDVTNNGNGSEAFRLSVDANLGGDDFDPVLTQIIIDSNNNGQFEPGVDTVYVSGANDPVILADETLRIFVITDTPGSVVDGNQAELRLSAAATTGSGTVGTVIAGGGDNGVDAVVGLNGAQDDDTGFLIVSSISVDFQKSATIADPLGGDIPYPGSIITYTLTATTSGSGTISGFSITDAIPAGTNYVPGSIRLNGSNQTDVQDSDAGDYDGTRVRAVIGDIGTGESHVVTFQVVIL